MTNFQFRGNPGKVEARCLLAKVMCGDYNYPFNFTEPERMHITTCPSCQRQLRVLQELARQQVKCRYCGAIFAATTQPCCEEPIPEEPLETVADTPAMPATEKKNRLGLMIAVLAGVVVIVAGCLVWWAQK